MRGIFAATFPDADVAFKAAVGAAAADGGQALSSLFEPERAAASAAAWHFDHADGKVWHEILALATTPLTEPAAFRKLAPRLDLIFTCYVDSFCISTLLNELSGATWRSVVKSNSSPHAAESMLLNLQSDVYLRRGERRAGSSRVRAGHLDGQTAILEAAEGAASHAEEAYSAFERARLKREGREPPSREHFRGANLRRKSVSDHAVALRDKLRKKADAAKNRKGHTPWTAVVASKRAAVIAAGGVQYDAAFQKAEKQAAAERVLNSDEQRDVVLTAMAAAPYWTDSGAAEQWGRLSHAAPLVALPLARFLVLAALQRTRQLIGEYVSNWCIADKKKSGGGRGKGRGGRGRGRASTSARGRTVKPSAKVAAASAQEPPPTAAKLEKLGFEAAKRLRARLCQGYQAAGAKHTATPVPSTAALKAAATAVRQDVQAFIKDPTGEVPVKWRHSAAHKKLLAQHKAEDAFDVLGAIDALLPPATPMPTLMPVSAQTASS